MYMILLFLEPMGRDYS